MKCFRKLCLIVAVFAMSFSMMTGAAAFNTESKSYIQTKEGKILESPNVQFEREDVSIATAASDAQLPVEKILDYVNENNEEPTARSVTWYCEGWYEDYSYNSMGSRVQRPCGLSEHRNGNTVLSTYHYTRTYLNKNKMYGDSGRVWGTGSVTARGTLVDSEVCDLNTHYVKYGTTSN